MRFPTTLFPLLPHALAAFAALFLVAPVAAEDCRHASSTVKLGEQRPGLHLGTVHGDLTGAIALQTIRENEREPGVVFSVVDLMFTDSHRGGFSALASTRTTSPNRDFVHVDGEGEILQGKGRYEGLTGALKLSLDEVSVGGDLEGRFDVCFR